MIKVIAGRNMRLIRNVRGISKLVLIILLVIAFIAGSFLSYLWTMGFYSPYEFRLPSKVSVTIEKIEFFEQDTSFFNLIVLNPSYSPSSATINRITVLTDDKVFSNIETQPSVPQELKTGSSQTLKCIWNWANYTGQTVSIIVSIAEGSGPSVQATTPYVGLTVAAYFNSSISVHRFNVTVQNAGTSATHVNITQLTINGETIPPQNITINGESVSFPHPLNPGEFVLFTCAWSWTDYQGRDVTIGVLTTQGYSASLKQLALPEPVTLEITDILLDPSDTSRFSVTIRNNETSPAFVSVNEIFLMMENGTTVKVLDVSPPYELQPNASASFFGFWNWTYYRNQTVIVTVNTVQGFSVWSAPKITPPPIILEIITVYFNPINTTRFNITVLNSPFSLSPANITGITIAFQNGTVIKIWSVEPPVPRELAQGESVVFTCGFEWFNYPDIDVTVTVYTAEGFKAAVPAKIPVP